MQERLLSNPNRNMKKLSLLFIASSISLFSIAQTDLTASNSEFFPKQGDFGIMGNVSGLISTIQASPRTDLRNESAFTFRYVQNEKLVFRFGLAPNIARYSAVSTDSIGKDLVNFDSTASRSSISFKPGIEYHFVGTKRLDPYMAFDLEFGLVGGLNIGSSTDITDTTGTSILTKTITEDGGFGVGTKLSFGLNYFITKKLFFGAEYGLGFRSITSGGDRQEVEQFQPVSGSSQTTRILSSNRVTTSDFFVDPRIQLTIGYFFSFK